MHALKNPEQVARLVPAKGFLLNHDRGYTVTGGQTKVYSVGYKATKVLRTFILHEQFLFPSKGVCILSKYVHGNPPLMTSFVLGVVVSCQFF